MNDLVQNGLVLVVFIISVSYLVRKFLWKNTSSKKKKACGSTGCGCA